MNSNQYMRSSTFVQELKNPETYGLNSSVPVTLIQTHISLVVLVGESAYKIKKPVDFGFLDFSTLERRKYYCYEEVRLNKRLCPSIYDKVVTITEQGNNSLLINGSGEIIDYAVKMHRFSQDKLMKEMLQHEMVTKEHIRLINDILVDFYITQALCQQAETYGSLDAVKQNIVENFDQTEEMKDVTVSTDQFEYIQKKNNEFFKKNASIFEKRIDQKKICDCHGDLHSGNIVINDDICIFDCIEFNKRFRYIDVASDIGFLAMDLDMMNHPFLSSFLINDYVSKSNDSDLFEVLNFYKSYRAYVRGKVLGFQLNDDQISEEKRNEIINTAQRYFILSKYYAELFSLPLYQKKPIIFIVSGLTGTGKSTLASKLSVDYHAVTLNTDIIRKKLAGIDKFERHHDEFDTGLYAPDRVAKTYDTMLQHAEDILKKGSNVVLDATFQQRSYRNKAQLIARNQNAIYLAIECVCPEPVAKRWLEERLKKETVSDGRWEIYQQQKKSFESFTDDEFHIIIDMAQQDFQKRMNRFQSVLDAINAQVSS